MRVKVSKKLAASIFGRTASKIEPASSSKINRYP
jgi:hypothetical protein